jgi:hypothetical protein
MVDAWPSDLPQALQAGGFSEGAGDGLLEYKPDTGPSITRRRSTAAMRPFNGSIICDDVQLASFRAFYGTTIMGGALPFEFPDQVQSGTLLVKFTKGSPPTWTNLGGPYYQVNLALMVLP